MALIRDQLPHSGNPLARRDGEICTPKISADQLDGAFDSRVTLDIAFHGSMKDLREEWLLIEHSSNLSVYQTYDWVNGWTKTQLPREGARLVLVSGRHNGELVIILPLLMQKGLVNRLDFIGDGHSNLNMPIIAPQYLSTLDEASISQFMQSLIQLMPGIGFIKLCRQPHIWNGKPNPLVSLPHQPSTHMAYGLKLEGEFSKTLKLINGKRKRKKYRWQMNALKSAAQYQFFEAKNTRQAHELLDAFFQQKAVRFDKLGMENVFEDAEDQNFLRKLAIQSIGKPNPTLALFGIEIDGEIRAVMGGGVHNKHFSASISSFSDDEWAYLSPGELLLYELVKCLNERGYSSIDMGVGEERYKRSWCPNEIELFDVLLPLSPASKFIVMAGTIWLTTKRSMRASKFVWPLIRQMRARKLLQKQK